MIGTNLGKVVAVAGLSISLVIVGCMSAMAANDCCGNTMASERPIGDIIETAVGPGMTDVTTLVAAVQAAELVDALKAEGPFTVFAPVNSAFAKLPEGTVAELLKPENKEQLQGILLYHVHAGAAIRAKDVRTMKLDTVNGKQLQIRVDGSNVMVNDAKVIKTDIVATNGIIHWIDTVVLP